MTDEQNPILRVNLPGDAYDIHFGKGICQSVVQRFRDKQKFQSAVVVTCETVYKLYKQYIQAIFEGIGIKIIVVPDGEAVKNMDTVKKILDDVFVAGLLRNDPIFCIGGGVVGDIGGFCASIYLRGVPYIQIPTTLLAMVDSSVGGKTGINHPGSKNSIGSFYQPKLVIVDTLFLDTLPDRELNAGMAEIIKHGLIKHASLFEYIERNRDELQRDFCAHTPGILFESCKIKASVIEKDEKENNLRMILNFGHTFGHMIETLTHYTRYIHGEALFAGMEFAAWLSLKRELINQADYDRITRLACFFAVPITLPEESLRDFLAVVKKDKKNRSAGISFVLLEQMGRATIQTLNPVELAAELNAFLQAGKSNIVQLQQAKTTS